MVEPLSLRPLLSQRPSGPYETFRVFPRAFTPTMCDRIVELGTDAATEHARVEADEGARGAPDLRDARIAWIPPGSASEWIYARLASVAERANRHYGFELSGFGEDLQFTCYDRVGDFYTWHQDGLDEAVATRKLSLVLQLSDPQEYRGAELEFFPPSVDLEPAELAELHRRCAQRGTVVAFPSFEYHRVLPLRSGVRRSLVSWVSGPPFR